MTTIKEAVSRLRNVIKAVKEDPFITDRFLYHTLLKYGQFLVKRMDSMNQLLKFATLFKTLPCVELIEVDRVEACCGGVQSGCTFKRSELKIPNVLEASFGPVFRTISSIDGSIEIYPTSPSIYAAMTRTTKFKYNKNKYYWYINGYLYFPNLDWEAIMVDGIFLGDISAFTNETGSGDKACSYRQDSVFPFPDYLFAEMEQMALRDLGITLGTPTDPATDDKQSQLR